MVKELKKIPKIDLFILIITGDRLGNKALVENLKVLEGLCGGGNVWKNVILVITKQDFNTLI